MILVDIANASRNVLTGLTSTGFHDIIIFADLTTYFVGSNGGNEMCIATSRPVLWLLGWLGRQIANQIRLVRVLASALELYWQRVDLMVSSCFHLRNYAW